MDFPSLLRQPDFVIGATEKSSYRFEEDTSAPCPVDYDFIVKNNSAKIIVHPSGSPIKFLKFRFNADLSFVESVCGDTWVCCGSEMAICWTSLLGYRILPWYCYLRSKEKMACYGVKTGADCFAFWQIDTKGITLFLNLTSGTGGTDLKESLLACEIVEYIVPDNQDYYKTATKFTGMMCDKPNLPKEPIFGLNDWYWAYGRVTQNIVISEIEMLSSLTKGLKHKPFLVIDDGWQIKRTEGEFRYIGGPWDSSEKFGSIERASEEIHKNGINAGVWFRPLLTCEDFPENALLRTHDNGKVFDPSHPYTLEKVASDVSKICNYGFELIKHDFSTWDILGKVPNNADGVNLCSSTLKFYDNTKTSATIIKQLYKTIQKAAGKTMIMGCGVVNHLAAGIHEINRISIDTSGRHYALTLCNGSNSFMRLPQNKKFYITDHDCAAFTEKVPFQENLNFLELCAISGTVTMASITPGLLNSAQLQKIADVFKIADKDDNSVEIVNFEKTAMPEKFIYKGIEKEYNWFDYYKGCRSQFNWME